jgi:dimethylamine monooxygenase subunit C
MDQGIKSRPRYEPLHLDPMGKRHLIVTDRAGVPAGAFATPPVGAEIWVGDIATILPALSERFGQETVGFRLYAVGTEGFIWGAASAALAAGMERDEVFLFQAGSLRRRIYCTHCKIITDDVTTSIVACTGCGVSLFVRDHFSRRIGAFMGVRVDAEQHGDLPPAEVLYP